MNPVPVATAFAALFGLLLLALSVLVVRARWRYQTGLGLGTEDGMQRAVRVQGNFTEYVPLTLLLLLLAELAGTGAFWLCVAGSLLLLGRLLHAWGLSHSSSRSFGRYWGTVASWLALLGLSLWLLAAPLV